MCAGMVVWWLIRVEGRLLGVLLCSVGEVAALEMGHVWVLGALMFACSLYVMFYS